MRALKLVDVASGTSKLERDVCYSSSLEIGIPEYATGPRRRSKCAEYRHLKTRGKADVEGII